MRRDDLAVLRNLPKEVLTDLLWDSHNDTLPSLWKLEYCTYIQDHSNDCGVVYSVLDNDCEKENVLVWNDENGFLTAAFYYGTSEG